MSMQIHVDPAGLTQQQREAVAGFILAYPGAACTGGGSCHSKTDLKFDVKVDAADVRKLAAGIAGAIPALVADDAATFASSSAASPGQVFGLPTVGAEPGVDPAAAFGSATAPLPPGAPAAPFTAGVAPLPTVPGVPVAGTSTAATTAPAPPAPNAGNTGTTAAPQTASPAVLDKAGLPWDGRIHAASKATIADGTWRKKKQLDPALVAQVEGELRALMAAPGATPAPTATTQAPAAPGTASLGTASTSATVAPPPPPNAFASSPTPAAGVVGSPSVAATSPGMGAVPSATPDIQGYVSLVGRVSAAQVAKRITPEEITAVCVAHGVAALLMLPNRLDLLPQIALQLDTILASRP